MKKQLVIILFLFALTLFSCGGNRTQAQSVEAKTDLKEMWEKIQEFCSEEDYGDYCFDRWQVVYNDNAEVPNIERLTYKGATVSDISIEEGEEIRLYANEIRVFKKAGGFEEFKWDGEKFVKK